MTEKNFRPYPEPEDYEEFEDYLEDLYNEDENSEETYQEIEDEIVGEELEGYWDKEDNGAKITIYPWTNSTIPSHCRNCSNHPSNGGSGVCLCILPYFEQQTSQYITYSTETTGQIELNGNVIITGSLEVS